MSWPTPQDYNEAIQNPHLSFDDAELKTGKPEVTPLGIPRPISGGFASVYRIRCDKREWAVRCFLRDFADQQQRYAAISRHLASTKLRYIVGFDFLAQGIRVRGRWYPILKMEWVQGDLLNEYIKRHLNNSTGLFSLATNWIAMVKTLQSASIAHGDLQHGNVLVVNGDFRLIDYDGMYVPDLAGQASHEVGHRNYQHPFRTELDFAPHLDNFSAWIIYVSLVALSIDPGLWRRVGAGDEFILFRKEDFDRPHASNTFSILTNHRDGRIQSLTSIIQSLLYQNLPQLPSLENPAILPTTATQTKSSNSDWLSDYIGQPQNKDAPVVSNMTMIANASLPSDNITWIFDHIQLQSDTLKSFSGSVIIPRIISFLSLVSLTIFLALSLSGGFLSLELILSTGVAILFLNALTFMYSYRRDPVKREMIGIIQREKEGRRILTALNKNVKNNEAQKAKLRAEENSNRQVLNKKRQKLQEKEIREKDAVEMRCKQLINTINARRLSINHDEAGALKKLQQGLGSDISSLAQKIASTNQEESAEISTRLNAIQDQFIKDYLKRKLISDASISGVGAKLRERLHIANIITAADIEYSRILRVEGIGENKARAMLSWKMLMLTLAKTDMPKFLDLNEVERITSKYRIKRVQLENQKNPLQQRFKVEENKIRDHHAKARNSLSIEQSVARTNADQELQAIVNRYAQKYAPISKELNLLADALQVECRNIDDGTSSILKRLAECHWQLAKTRRELAIFKKISFTFYVWHVLLGQRKPSKQAKP